MSDANAMQGLWLSWSIYAKHTGRLPEEAVKRNIRKHGVASRGSGSTRLVRLTPDNLHLFYDDATAEQKRRELFKLEDTVAPSADGSPLEETIFSLEGQMIHVQEFSQEVLDLERGVYLNARQVGLLTGYRKEQRIRDILEQDLGLESRTFYHKTLWYLIRKTDLERVPRNTLSAEDIDEITRLVPILKNDVIALAYDITPQYVSVLTRDRDEKLQFEDKVAYSEKRLEYALGLYKDSTKEKVRQLIIDNVFKEAAEDFGKIVAQELPRYLCSLIGLYNEVGGYDDFYIPRIRDQVKQLATQYAFDLIMNELANTADLPQSVQQKRFTLREWIDEKLRVYLTGLMPDKLTNGFEDAIKVLTPDEQETVRMMYSAGLSALGRGYYRPSNNDVALALGLKVNLVTELQESAIEKLRQLEVYSKFQYFLSEISNDLTRVIKGNIKT